MAFFLTTLLKFCQVLFGLFAKMGLIVLFFRNGISQTHLKPFWRVFGFMVTLPLARLKKRTKTAFGASIFFTHFYKVETKTHWLLCGAQKLAYHNFLIFASILLQHFVIFILALCNRFVTLYIARLIIQCSIIYYIPDYI